MKIIILDFADWKVKIVNNVPDESDIEDYETFLSEEYGFSISNIEYMVVHELEIETFE